MSIPAISLLLPTRGRPALVARLFDSIRARTSRLDRVQVVLYIDDDDTGSHGISDPQISLTKIIGPRISMGAYNSACLGRSDGDVVILINDDMVIRTDGWDDMVRSLDSRFEDRIYLGYGNDLYKGRDLCAFPILSRRCCDILVEPYPHAYQGAFIDYHLLDIFKRIQKKGHDRICYLEDLVFEHMHFRSGKGSMDSTYTARRRFGDDDAFLRLRDVRSDSAVALIYAINAEPVKPPVRAVQTGRAGLLRATLLDPDLPLRWALRLFFWFLARFAARRVAS